MKTTITQIINKPKQLFLVDGVGAVVSAFMLGVVLVKFEATFGMPKTILYVLAFIPCMFALYSFSCFLKRPQNWQRYLRIIAISNLLYCCLTLGLMVFLYKKLMMLGFLYFIGEIILVVTLSMIELKTASN